jgi:hypothetical protein
MFYEKKEAMKRYQCTKTIRHELFEFKPGFIYDFKENPGGNFYGYTTITGRIIWLKSSEIRDYFQELIDLNVDEHEEEQYTALLPHPKRLATGCAIVVAAILTIIITLLSLI